MKKGLLVALSTILASSLFANGVELQVVKGRNFPDSSKLAQQYEISNTIGVRTNFFLSTNNALQLAYDKIEDIKDNKDAHRYSVNYLHIERDNGTLTHPFILFGGGYEDGIKEGQGFINLGAGMAVNITNNISIVGEIKALRKNVNKDMEVNTNLGIGIMFGDEPHNVIIKKDCLSDKVATKLIREKIVKPIAIPVTDDKENCVR